MARWKLINAHYLNVPGTEWEQRETDAQTGKSARKVYLVPLLLDPNNLADQTPPKSGETIVAHADGKHERWDVIFEGPPTPEMEPLDEEAEAITEACRPSWVHPVETLNANGPQYDQQTLQMMESFAKAIGEQFNAAMANKSMANVSQEEFDTMKKQLAALLAERSGTNEKAPPAIARKA